MNEFYLINLLLLIGYSMFHYIYFKRLTKKQILLSFLPGLIIFTLNVLIFRGIDQEIVREIPAISYDSTNEAAITTTSITLKGTLTTRLFMDDEFTGTFNIEHTDLKHNNPTSITLISEPSGYMGFIHYLNQHGSTMFGDFYYFISSKDLNEIIFFIESSNSKVIGPATTLEEAKQLEEKIALRRLIE